MVVHRSRRVLAREGGLDAPPAALAELPGIADALAGRETTAFWPGADGMVEVVTVPIFIGRPSAEILGTLSVGFAFDDRLAGRFKDLTESEIAFALDGRIQAGTLPKAHDRLLEGFLRATSASPCTWTARSTSPSRARSPPRPGPHRPRLAARDRPHPAVAHEAAELRGAAAHGAGGHRAGGRGPGHPPELRGGPHRDPPAARHHRRHAGDGGHGRPRAGRRVPPPAAGRTRTRGCSPAASRA
jgi:hypothetical protein